MRRIALFGLALILAAPAMPAQAGDGIDLGTIVGAGLGGVIGNQIGHGTGKTVATVAGVILGGVAGHTVDRNWDGRSTRSYYNTTSYAAPQPVYYHYQPNYVAPPAPPPTVVYSQYNYGYGHHHRPRPVVIEQPTIIQQNIVPVSYQQPEAQPYCREYSNRVVVGGRVQESYGTACMQPDGSWQIVN